MRPPPAQIPTMARQLEGIVFLAPDGMRTLVLFPSSAWPTMTAEHPDARATVPRSPIFSSSMEMAVPSGMFPSFMQFPTANCAPEPQ